ncbi:MAG: hypothetical protein JWL93_903 [Hyphomicrobiales bacterium]|nr:hypothetical protein [Hyphomicrobiales bacterium]
MNENAIVVRAGRRSLHPGWLQGGVPKFDLHVVAYEPLPEGLLAGTAGAHLLPGTKVDGWRRFFGEHADDMLRYARIALLDDDLMCTAQDLNRCFEIGRQESLALWQPALSWNSYFSHAITLQNPMFRLRYTNFIEMMCPFFTAEHLQKTLPIFDLGIELGVDQLWCRTRDEAARAYGVIDEVTVVHTRKVGQFRANQGFVGRDDDYRDYIARIQREVGYRAEPPVSHAGILRNGRTVSSRLAMSMLALAPLAGARQSVNSGWFSRPVFNHAARCLLTGDASRQVDLSSLRHAHHHVGQEEP